MNIIIRNSILSILLGLGITVGACYCAPVSEPVNYVGAMFIFGGLVFVDRFLVEKIFRDGKRSKMALVRLAVYLFAAVIMLMLPIHMEMAEVIQRPLRGIGIAFLVLALWRFFTFTTTEEQNIH